MHRGFWRRSRKASLRRGHLIQTQEEMKKQATRGCLGTSIPAEETAEAKALRQDPAYRV